MTSAFALTDLIEAARARERDPVLTGLDDAALEERVRHGASALAAATCRWLDAVAEFVVRGIWADQGFTTPATWLAWAVGMGGSTAREHVRVALSLSAWPGVHAAFAAGELSFSKVRAITRSGLPELEDLLLRYATHADGAQLERILRGFAVAARPTDERTPFERRTLTSTEVGDGMAELRLVAPTEVIASVMTVLSRQAEAARRDDRREGVEDRPSSAVYRADVLTALVERAGDEIADASGADRHTVVHLVPAVGGDRARHLDTVPVQRRAGTGVQHRAMSRRTLERLSCTAGLATAHLDEDGSIADMTGRTRRVPPRMWRALMARDQRCRYPGCGRVRWLDAHHIRHVADGGATRMDNLVVLCTTHHHTVHDRDVTIVHDGRGHLRFVLADGRQLEPSPKLPGASAEALRPQVSGRASPHLQPTSYTQRIDLASCVDVLLQELALLQPPDPTALAA